MVAAMPDDTPNQTTNEALDLVLQFCAAFGKGATPAELVEYFADDAVYHNIPVEPAVGREAILGLLNMFLTPTEGVEFRVLNIVANGDTVLTERVDVFQLPNAVIELPVMGTFEVRGGKIAAWRDYFDLNQYMSQLQGAGE
jgi:limonene-1,2-epoxide hydrolase